MISAWFNDLLLPAVWRRVIDDRRLREVYWRQPPRGKFRVRYEAPHWVVERFDADKRRWKFVELGRDKEKVVDAAREHLAREALLPVYLDPDPTA